jgi:hypothetical protein
MPSRRCGKKQPRRPESGLPLPEVALPGRDSMILRRYLIIPVQLLARHPIEWCYPTAELQLRVDKRSEMSLALVTTVLFMFFYWLIDTQPKLEKAPHGVEGTNPLSSSQYA